MIQQGKLRIAGESGDCWGDTVGEWGEVDTDARIEGGLYRGCREYGILLWVIWSCDSGKNLI